MTKEAIILISPPSSNLRIVVTCQIITRTLWTILILIFQLSVYGQEIVRQDSYYDFKKGIYNTKSITPGMIGFKPFVIEPQTKFIDREKTAFLKIDNKVIALFDKINDLGTSKPVGVLTKTSVIQVDTIFYLEIYKDTTKEWSLTYNVWYAITINGLQYYTDYKIHTFIGNKEKIDEYQDFLLIYKNTGYDEYYDNGYPDYFFVAILNNKEELIYDSKILDFNYGDGFWDASSVTTEITNNEFKFKLIGLEENFEGIWTGKEIKKYGR